jgi:Predicted membrane protein
MHVFTSIHVFSPLQVISVIRKLCNFNAGRYGMEQIDTSSTPASRRPPRDFSSSGGGSGFGGGKFARGGGGFRGGYGGGGYRGGYGGGGGFGGGRGGFGGGELVLNNLFNILPKRTGKKSRLIGNCNCWGPGWILSWIDKVHSWNAWTDEVRSWNGWLSSIISFFLSGR